MKRNIFFVACLLIYVASERTLGTSDSKNVWEEKLEKIEELAKQFNIKEEANQHERATGTVDFNVSLKCTPEPITVHRLRPRDIDVVAAMGDSLTAANGANASTIVGVATEFRGISWTVGGEDSLQNVLTLPNILRKFNPAVKGYSVGTRADPNRDWWFNVAVPGARARNMPEQARTLLSVMKNDERTNFENDWKIVTIFIGGNDLCALNSSSEATPEKYTEYLKEALDILHSGMRRTLVNVIEILEIYLLPQVGQGVGSTAVCRAAQSAFCGFVVNAQGEDLEFLRRENKRYQTLVQELIHSGRYDDRDDFTVVIQPFFRDTSLPLTESGEVDATYFAPDCFHFGSKAHAMGALNLWNNMLEPVGAKTTQWTISDLKCPTEESPYIFTNINSPPYGSGDADTTTAQLSTTTKTPSPVECDDSCTGSVEDWVIAVICVLGVAILAQTITLLLCFRKKSAKKYNYKM